MSVAYWVFIEKNELSLTCGNIYDVAAAKKVWTSEALNSYVLNWCWVFITLEVIMSEIIMIFLDFTSQEIICGTFKKTSCYSFLLRKTNFSDT